MVRIHLSRLLGERRMKIAEENGGCLVCSESYKHKLQVVRSPVATFRRWYGRSFGRTFARSIVRPNGRSGTRDRSGVFLEVGVDSFADHGAHTTDYPDALL